MAGAVETGRSRHRLDFEPVPRADFCDHIDNVIRGNENADRSAGELFRGTCEATANANLSPVSVEIWVTDSPRDLAGLTQAFRDRATLYEAAWNQVKSSDATLDDYIVW